MLNNPKALADNKGSLPAYSWPGGYPICYLTKDNSALCPQCANSTESQQAEDWEKNWEIIAYEINYEDESLCCDECSENIESAYSDE